MKKYFLVDPTRYEMLVQSHNSSKLNKESESIFMHPNIKKVAQIDKQMDRILNNSELTDFEKNEQYNTKLESYIKNFRSAVETPKNEALLGKQMVPQQQQKELLAKPSELQSKALTPEMSFIPESYHQSAQKLINFLQNNKSFSWGDDGELKYNNTPIDGSNVTKLLNDAVRHRKITSSETTFNKFIDALENEGYPVHQLSVKQKSKSLNPVTLPLNFSKKKKKFSSSRVTSNVKRKRKMPFISQALSPSATQEQILRGWMSSS